MRNSKMKGFTLIELIVVIAIIGILAAILVPSMLGYVRNAKISSANAGAKQIHTAAASVLTQLGVSNFSWSSGTGSSAETYIDIAGTKVTWQGVKRYPNTDDVAIGSYLGDNFTGYGRAFFDGGTYSVSCAVYAEQKGAWDFVSAKTATEKSVLEFSEATQKNDAKNSYIYGIYPAPKTGASTNK